MFNKLKQITQQLRVAHHQGNASQTMSLIAKYEDTFTVTEQEYNRLLTQADKGSAKRRAERKAFYKEAFNSAKLNKGELSLIRKAATKAIQAETIKQAKIKEELTNRQQAWDSAVHELDMIEGHQAAAEAILKSNCRDYLGLVQKYQLIHKARYRAIEALPTFDTASEAIKKSQRKEISEIGRQVNAEIRQFEQEYQAVVVSAVKGADATTGTNMITNIVESLGLLLGSEQQKSLRDALANLTPEEKLALKASLTEFPGQTSKLLIQDADSNGLLVPFIEESLLIAQDNENQGSSSALIAFQTQVSVLQKVAQKTGDKALVSALKAVEQQLANVASGKATQLSLLRKTNGEIKVVHIGLGRLASGNLSDIINIIQFMRPTPDTQVHIRLTTPPEAARLSLINGSNISALTAPEMQQLGYITDAVSNGALVPSALGALVGGSKAVLESNPEFLALVKQFSNGGLVRVGKEGAVSLADLNKVVRAMTVALTAGKIAAQSTSLKQALAQVGLLSAENLMIDNGDNPKNLAQPFALTDVTKPIDHDQLPLLLIQLPMAQLNGDHLEDVQAPIVEKLLSNNGVQQPIVNQQKTNSKVDAAQADNTTNPMEITEQTPSTTPKQTPKSVQPSQSEINVGGSNLMLKIVTEVLKGLSVAVAVAGAVAAVSALIVATGGFGLAPVAAFGGAVVAKAGIVTGAIGLGTSTLAVAGTAGATTVSGFGLYGLFSSINTEKQPSLHELDNSPYALAQINRSYFSTPA